MTVNRGILECWDNLNRDIDACLGSPDYNHAMGCLRPDVKAAILGKWKPRGSRDSEKLAELKVLVSNVKGTMFRGSNHVFCVSVTPKNKPVPEGQEWCEQYEDGESPWYMPKRSGLQGCQWDFELSVYRQYNMHIKTLFRGSTPPLHVTCRGIRDAAEVKVCVGDTYENKLIMKFDEPVLLVGRGCESIRRV